MAATAVEVAPVTLQEVAPVASKPLPEHYQYQPQEALPLPADRVVFPPPAPKLDPEEQARIVEQLLSENSKQPVSCCSYFRAPDGRPPTNPALSVCFRGESTGNTLALYRAQAGSTTFPRVFIIGPDWPCLCFTFLLIFGPTIAFLCLVAPKIDPAVLAVGLILLFVTVGALSWTAFSDPGIRQRQSPHELETQKARLREAGALGAVTECGMCNILRENGTHHCYDCGVCIEELDHHCPWTGKCIGKGNLRAFYTFVWSVGVLVVYVAACTFVWVITRAIAPK